MTGLADILYGKQPDATFFQGDILRDVALFRAPEKLLLARQVGACERLVELVPIETVPDAFVQGLENILVPTFRTTAMILSQTCDIEHRDFILIAPIFPLSQIEQQTRREAIMKDKVNYRFYLPSIDALPESFVDLQIINTILKEHLSLDQRMASLSDRGRHMLAEKIHRFFCRPFI